MSESCEWKFVEEDWLSNKRYFTSCDDVHFDVPVQADFQFCPYCGKTLEVKNEVEAI